MNVQTVFAVLAIVAALMFLLSAIAGRTDDIEAGVHIGNVSDEGRDE
jgi:Na+-transporting methylmalonyl-CoA/oxaloacetate decarboxylase gamma subunit